ncbi:unnamed protein product [Phaedon cochleariae]|uniref:Uncharacterized protein n=1 Tax=Phaedon cochleariae TaxID=80249 RepID=A0A9N9SCY4_PHACE|nr:unnamed protein product [Phaedon cochleariae]
MAIELKKSELIFNKPLYIGIAILDLSKIVMFDFHYNFMLPKLGADVKLMYTDTDSFIYEIVCDDVYSEVIDANIERFDTSDYAPDNIYGIPRVNKKVLGLLKNEANGKIITHFAGLRSKMYSYKLDITDEDIEKERKRLERKGFSKERLDRELENFGINKKSKGVKKCVVKNKLTSDDYVNCLTAWKGKTVAQQTIRSYAHDVFPSNKQKLV